MEKKRTLTADALLARIARYSVTQVKTLYREYGSAAVIDRLLADLADADRIYYVTPSAVRST